MEAEKREDENRRAENRSVLALAISVVTLIGSLLTLIDPGFESRERELDNLIAQRNLIFGAQRIAVLALKNSSEGNRNPIETQELNTANQILQAINFGSIQPASIGAYFIDIWNMTKRAERAASEARTSNLSESPEMLKTYAHRAEENLCLIDNCIWRRTTIKYICAPDSGIQRGFIRRDENFFWTRLKGIAHYGTDWECLRDPPKPRSCRFNIPDPACVAP